MNIKQATEIVVKIVKKELKDKNIKVNEKTPLIGGKSLLDSMKLIEVCVKLEDYAEENSFEFDWTSSKAMSKSLSMFRNVGELAKEFQKQSGG